MAFASTKRDSGEDHSFLPIYDDPSMTDISYSIDHDSSSRSDSSESTRSSSPSPTLGQAPADDISIKTDPDRHVDYLSHEWSENDIWVSWRHVTKQKAFLQSGARLENASWRTWAKSRNNLKTISPETLNWLKDCDVTWLYGPLHRGTNFDSLSSRGSSEENLSQPAKIAQTIARRGSEDWSTKKPSLQSCSSSYVVPSRRSNKPILKKRSNSEMMLARHNLVKEDCAIPNTAGQSHTPAIEFSSTTKTLRPTVIRTHSANSALRSARKQHFRKETGGELPKRRIHFNESVEQCISIIKADPEDEDYNSSSSEDDAPTMRISAPRPPSNIAKLPSTKLKLPSPSHTGHLQYPNSNAMAIFAENDELGGGADQHDTVNSIGMATTRSSRSNSTDSAILPNYDGIQDSSPPPGIFGRAAEVVYSARDLVSVMWSASSGWRRTDAQH